MVGEWLKMATFLHHLDKQRESLQLRLDKLSPNRDQERYFGELQRQNKTLAHSITQTFRTIHKEYSRNEGAVGRDNMKKKIYTHLSTLDSIKAQISKWEYRQARAFLSEALKVSLGSAQFLKLHDTINLLMWRANNVNPQPDQMERRNQIILQLSDLAKESSQLLPVLHEAIRGNEESPEIEILNTKIASYHDRIIPITEDLSGLENNQAQVRSIEDLEQAGIPTPDPDTIFTETRTEGS